MRSKTMQVLVFFGAVVSGSEKSVHVRPRESERTKEFAARCWDVLRECCLKERAGECGLVRFVTYIFVLDKAKLIPIIFSLFLF